MNQEQEEPLQAPDKARVPIPSIRRTRIGLETSHYKAARGSEKEDIVSLPGPGVVELRSWTSSGQSVDLWDYQNSKIGIKMDLDTRSIEEHLAGNHHRQTLRDREIRSKERSRVKVCYCSEHTEKGCATNTSFAYQESSKEDSSTSASYSSKRYKKDQVEGTEKFDNETVRKDYLNELKEEKKAHQVTKELVKTLKTKVNCLNSDYSELQGQYADLEENMVKVKKGKEKEIEFLKLCLKAKREAELLSLKVSSSKNTSMLGGKGLVQKSFPLARPDLVEVAQQTEIDGKIVDALAEPKDLVKSGKLELVEEVAEMVEEVLMENTKIIQVNTDLNNDNNELKEANDLLEMKSKERRDAQKVFLDKFDQLKEEERELQSKVLRLTIENMKLKRENHEARTK